MKWIVGVDLRHCSDGAIKFGAWLRSSQSAGSPSELVGVHVIEAKQLASLDRFDGRARVLKRIEDESKLVVRNAGVADAFAEIDVVEGRSAAKSLEDARVAHHGDGLIVGRKAGIGQNPLVRLGSVARKVLRTLSGPAVVVAPDLDVEAIGDGPIVVAATPTDVSLGACKFARELGEALGREVLFVRVVEVPEDYAHIYWSENALASFRTEYVEEARDQLKTWLEEHGFADAKVEMRLGPIVAELVDAATEHAAPCVISGARLLGTIERMLTSSTSSELAAQARCAVIVVPAKAD